VRELVRLHTALAQKLDKLTESNRVETLAKAALLVELGLPNEAAAKVFLAGVRSRTAARELGDYIPDASASVTWIRAALLNPSTIPNLQPSVSPATLDWLRLLAAERDMPLEAVPTCTAFRMDAPKSVSVIHVRQPQADGPVYLCSTDGRLKLAVGSTPEMPFDRLANDYRFVFVREASIWHQRCRDPHVPNPSSLGGWT
jgi:hypothetical protein